MTFAYCATCLFILYEVDIERAEPQGPLCEADPADDYEATHPLLIVIFLVFSVHC